MNSNITNDELQLSKLIFAIEEKYGYETHMVIEEIYKDNDSNDGPNWWVEFQDTKKALDTLEDVKTFFLEECEA